MDLSSYPSEIFRDFYKRLNWTSFDLAILHPEDIIFRARLNESDESFKLVNDLSYKPATICKNWQRASSPGNTMFYGSFIPKDCTTEQYNNALLSTAFEIVPLQADNKTDGFLKKKITYSVWTVKQFDSLGVITTLEDMKSGKGTSNFSEARTYVIWLEPSEEKK